MSPAFAKLSALEVSTCQAFNQVNRMRFWGRMFAAISRIGDGWIWYCLILTLPLWGGWQAVRVSCLMAVGGLLCTWLYKWIKGRTRRPRPSEVEATLQLTVAPLDRFSFPSGHTLHAVMFTIVASWYLHPLAWVLVPLTVLVALSRLVLGLHYPSDVLVGAVIGGIMGAATIGVGVALKVF